MLQVPRRTKVPLSASERQEAASLGAVNRAGNHHEETCTSTLTGGQRSGTSTGEQIINST